MPNAPNSISVPVSINVPIGRGGKYGTLAVDITQFNDDLQMYVYVYGLKRVLNDATANKTDAEGNTLENGAILALAEKRLANMYAGELRAQRAAGEPADPVEAEVHKIATANIRAMLGSIVAPKDVKGPVPRLLWQINKSRADRNLGEVANMAEAITLYMAGPKGKDVRKSAERIVRERQASAGELAESGI